MKEGANDPIGAMVKAQVWLVFLACRQAATSTLEHWQLDVVIEESSGQDSSFADRVLEANGPLLCSVGRFQWNALPEVPSLVEQGCRELRGESNGGNEGECRVRSPVARSPWSSSWSLASNR